MGIKKGILQSKKFQSGDPDNDNLLDGEKKRRPGPRFEPGSEDPQSSRITNYPTPACLMTVLCQRTNRCPFYIGTGL